MKRLMILTGALTLFAISAGAQSQPSAQAGVSASNDTALYANRSDAQASSSSSAAASAQAGKNSLGLTSGTSMQATLTHPVDCKKNKPGDMVTAKNTSAVTSNGQVVIPKGSRLIGHVTEVHEHQKQGKNREEQDSALGIAWDKAVLKDGQEIPINASVQALASAQGQAFSAIEDSDMPIGGGAMASGSGGGRGALGGVGSVGDVSSGAFGAAAQPIGNVGSAATSTLNSTANAAAGSTANVSRSGLVASTGAVGGLNAAGQFVPNSRGVFGLSGLSLASAASNSTEASVITSNTQNVHLESGTRMLLVVQGQGQANADAALSSGSRASQESKQSQGGNPSGSRPQDRDQQ